MSKLFQIREDDLAELEHLLPEIADVVSFSCGHDGKPRLDNRLKVQIRRVREIIADVRWNYGPPDEVMIIPAGDAPTA